MPTRTVATLAIAAILVTGCSVTPVRGTDAARAPAAPPLPVDTAFRLEPQTGPAADPWRMIQDGFALAELTTEAVVARERWLLEHRDYLHAMLERARLYLPHIAAAVAARGIPLEIALLPAVESGFKPLSHSPSGAAGLWQFIPATARHYGLAITPDYDARLDIVASTDAALRYLDDLAQRFDGDWLLAIAAYNAGPGAVEAAIEANRHSGRPSTFSGLDLRPQTRQYVPKLIALRNILRQSQRYGVKLPVLPAPPTFVAVDAPAGTSLAAVAAATATRLSELRRLNPGFLRDTVPRMPSQVAVLVPPRAAGRAIALAGASPVGGAMGQVYRVAAGDTLSAIGRRHQVSPARLAAHNDLDGDFLAVNQTLRIPPQTADPAVERNADRRPTALEFPWDLTMRHRLPVRSLAWNGGAVEQRPADRRPSGPSAAR